MKGLILSFLNQLSLTCGKLWKKSYGVWKEAIFEKILVENFKNALEPICDPQWPQVTFERTRQNI